MTPSGPAGFVKFAPKRHGFLDGLILDGTPLPRPEGRSPPARSPIGGSTATASG